MRQAVVVIASAGLLAISTPALAQDQTAVAPANPDRIVFDLGNTGPDAQAEPVRTTGFRIRQQSATPPPACTSDSDIIQAQAAGPQRYDDNGAPVRTPASCTLDQPRVSTVQATSPTAFLREPPCEESATGYACASSGTAGANTYERSAQCQETATARTCSSSFSIGNSEEGRNAAQEAIDRLRAD